MANTPAGTTAPRRRRTRYLDGDKLLAARVNAKLTQGQLADKAGNGCTQSLVSMWERGRQGTDLETLGVLAGALGVKPAALMPDDLLARIKAGDSELLRQMEARGVVIEIPAARQDP